ncbi:MAG: diguanylate cyclase [Betaproteobacteria bacterium]
MEIFATDDEVAMLEQSIATPGGTENTPAMLSLAWHLRQRNPQRALDMVQQLERSFVAAGEHDPGVRCMAARCNLVRAEGKWLNGELDSALELTMAARENFSRDSDGIGMADASWLSAMIAGDRGDSAGRDAGLEAAILHAHEADDERRELVSQGAMAAFAIYRDMKAAEARWGKRIEFMPARNPAGDAIVISWTNEFWGSLAYQTSDFERSVSIRIPCYEAALATGQLRRSIMLATNIGACFNSLNDNEAALEWMQKGLDIARPTGWPLSVGMALMQTGETLRLLGRLEPAQDLLDEALVTLTPLAGVRAYAIVLNYLGDLALDRQDFPAALDFFVKLKLRADALNHKDLQSIALRGQAHALLYQGRPDEALRVATAAVSLAQDLGDGLNECTALRVLAEIHARHPSMYANAPGAGSEALRLLLAALEAAEAIDGYAIPGELFSALADEYAKLEQFSLAYKLALRAGEATARRHGRETTNRIIAMQVRHKTEGERVRNEHLTKLAFAEAKRAGELQQTTATLERLGTIGQEITAHLDTPAVFNVLHRHLNGLLQATSLSIFLVEPDGKTLRLAFGLELGERLPETRLAIEDPNAISARCVREKREFCVDVTPDAFDLNLIPGTLSTLSRLFAPLAVGTRVLGVMSVQSMLPFAYGEREKLIFRTLCAYGAIALDNAATYQHLASTLQTLQDTRNVVLEQNRELERVNHSLKEASLTDPLTGLRNRRFLIEHIEDDVAGTLRRFDNRAKAGSGKAENRIFFFMVDLDHFKDVNDRFGHAAGDEVLTQMKARLLEVVRDADYVVRWGGEEFLVVATATTSKAAKAFAARLCDVVSKRPFALPDGTAITKTCSVGFAGYPFFPEDPRRLSWLQTVELADRALYFVKGRGRNGWMGIQCSDSPGESQVLDEHLVDMPGGSNGENMQLVASDNLRRDTSADATIAA